MTWIGDYGNGQHRRTNPSLHGGPNYGTGSGYSARTFFTSAGATLSVSSFVNTASAVLTITGPRTPIEYGGIRVGEIEAWRAWKTDGCHVFSTVTGDIWRPGLPMLGNVASGFGVHAWKSKANAITYAWSGMVVGRVMLWGDVIECENGYRAEYAKILSFDRFYGVRINLNVLRRTYGLPIEINQSLLTRLFGL